MTEIVWYNRVMNYKKFLDKPFRLMALIGCIYLIAMLLLNVFTDFSYENIEKIYKDKLKKSFYKEKLQGTVVRNEQLGLIDIDENGEVNFTRAGREEMANRSYGENKLLLVKYLPVLIESANDITSSEPKKEKHQNEYFYYLHTRATFPDGDLPVKITLIKRNNGKIQYYDHYVITENGKKNEGVVASTAPASSDEALGTPSVHQPSFTESVAQNGKNNNSKPIFGEYNEAELFEALGIEAVEDDDVVLSAPDNISNTAEERARLEAKLAAKLNRISANPVFDPEIYTLALQIGFTYIKDGYSTA